MPFLNSTSCGLERRRWNLEMSLAMIYFPQILEIEYNKNCSQSREEKCRKDESDKLRNERFRGIKRVDGTGSIKKF